MSRVTLRSINFSSMFFVKYYRVNDIVIEYQCKRSQNNRQRQGCWHLAVSRDKSFNKSCDNEKRDGAYHHFKPIFCTFYKRYFPRIGLGEQNTVSHYQSSSSGNYNYGNLNGSVEPNVLRSFKKQSLVVEHREKCTKHNSVAKQDIGSSHRSENAQGIGYKRHANVVDRNA